jgi:hypothetical protein
MCTRAPCATIPSETMLEADLFALPGPPLDALPLRPRRRAGRLWLWMKLVCRARALDRDLAAGGRPDRDELHASRTLQLLSATYRRQIAEGLEKAVRVSARRRGPELARSQLQRTAIWDERAALLDLATRLLSPRPASAQGVAIAVLLLSEPDSPLHEPARPGAIGALARTALDGLEHLD